MFFTTQSGSKYELDQAGSRIRRISGSHAPTNNQGRDGEWKQYHTADVHLGYPAVIQWDQGLPRFTVTSRRFTVTSRVTSLSESN